MIVDMFVDWLFLHCTTRMIIFAKYLNNIYIYIDMK